MMKMANSATASPSPNVTIPTTSATVRMAKALVDCGPESPLAVSSFAALAKVGRGKVRQVGAAGYPPPPAHREACPGVPPP